MEDFTEEKKTCNALKHVSTRNGFMLASEAKYSCYLHKYYKKYLDLPRLAYCKAGDGIKYDENSNMEWIFSPRSEWFVIPKKIRNEINKYKLKWNLDGKYISK
jgi:hypothetical protein